MFRLFATGSAPHDGHRAGPTLSQDPQELLEGKLSPIASDFCTSIGGLLMPEYVLSGIAYLS